jgi:hypothetical protein
MEKIKCSGKVTNEVLDVHERRGGFQIISRVEKSIELDIL